MVPATQNQIVYSWITVIDELYIAMVDLKSLRTGYPVSNVNWKRPSLIPEILASLPPSLRVKLPKEFLDSYGFMVLSSPANTLRAPQQRVAFVRGCRERRAEMAKKEAPESTSAELHIQCETVVLTVSPKSKPEPLAQRSLSPQPLPRMTTSAVDQSTLTGADLRTADTETMTGARSECTTLAKVPVEVAASTRVEPVESLRLDLKGLNSSVDAHTLGLSIEIVRAQTPHTRASLSTT
jgi:hypothetical protein